ncbi:MAG: hypothetical protein ACFCBU_00175 [Cyanophyceae cyanobacterium]
MKALLVRIGKELVSFWIDLQKLNWARSHIPGFKLSQCRLVGPVILRKIHGQHQTLTLSFVVGICIPRLAFRVPKESFECCPFIYDDPDPDDIDIPF